MFAFAVPFRSVADDAALLAHAESLINADNKTRPPIWYMADGAHSRYHNALSLRLTYLNHVLLLLRKRASSLSIEGDPSSMLQWAKLEHSVTLWRNAHVMLTLALEDLNFVPADTDAAWDALLTHFSPDVNMMFHAGEMPDVRDELYATPILKDPPPSQSAQNKVRAANPVSLAFTKVCPRRCGMRDLVEILLEYGVRNVASLYFVMLVMAASYLGAYDFCKRRPDLAMTRDVYRLFFFEQAEPLRAHRRQRESEATLLEKRFTIGASDIDMYITRGRPRVTFASYRQAIWKQYLSASDKADKATADTSKAAGKAKKARASAAVDNSARATMRQRSEATVATMATVTKASATSSAKVIDLDEHETRQRSALALANATARLEFDRQCGYEYHEQRAAAGKLPIVNGKPQEYVAPETNVTDVYAFRRIAECDRVMPTDLQLARRTLVFRFLGTLIEYDNPRPSDNERENPPSREYPFTSMLTQQIREFMFHLLSTERALNNELCARVQWLSWSRSVIAISDLLRARLSDAYTGSMTAFLRRHKIHHRVSVEQHAPTNNLFSTNLPPFITPLYKAMTAHLQSSEFMSKRVDRVVPREYGIMMAELLRFFRYPRSYDESTVPEHTDDLASTTMSNTADDDARTVYYPFIETISPALPPFGITLTKDVPPDDATEEWIVENMSSKLLFPGRLFSISTASIDAFNRTYMMYASGVENDKLLTHFAKNLAATSRFQFMLVYEFVRAVETYLSVYTVPLPTHIVQQQMRVMCARFGCSDPARVPRHAHYSLVCLSCRRYAGFIETPKKPNVRYAVGTSDVRTLDEADDQVMIERVRQRGRLLAPDELRGAESMYSVFEHRAMYTTRPYDRYCVDPIDEQIEARRRHYGSSSEQVEFDVCAVEPSRSLDKVRALFSAAMERLDSMAGEPLPDWRTTDSVYRIDANGRIAAPDVDLHGVPLPPMRLVAIDGESDSEAEFDRQVRHVYDRLMGGRFFRMGYRIPTPDNRPYMAATDSRRNLRREFKKRKAHMAEQQKIKLLTNEGERKRRADKLHSRCCKDILSLVNRVHCSTQLMYQFSRIGNALVIASRNRSQRSVDVIVDCCGCGTSMQFAHASTRGCWWFCRTCIADGSWVIWFDRDRQGNDAMMDSFDSAVRDTELSLTARLMSPGRSWLPDSCVRPNEKCVHPKCRRTKVPGVAMASKEVVFDTPGNEHVGYVSICPVHQKMFPWIMTLPVMLSRSMLAVLLHDGKTQISIDDMRQTDYLSTYMTRLAELSSNNGTSSSASTAARARTGPNAKRSRSILEQFDDENKE